MTKKFWFKPKRFGYGFYPISWQGWLSILIYLAVLFLSAYTNNFFCCEISTKEGMRFILDLILITTIASLLFYPKTEGPLKWHWSRKDKEKNRETTKIDSGE